MKWPFCENIRAWFINRNLWTEHAGSMLSMHTWTTLSNGTVGQGFSIIFPKIPKIPQTKFSWKLKKVSLILPCISFVIVTAKLHHETIPQIWCRLAVKTIQYTYTYYKYLTLCRLRYPIRHTPTSCEKSKENQSLIIFGIKRGVNFIQII